MCPSCDEYDVQIEIHDPAQLRRIVKKLQVAVEDGVLVVDADRSGEITVEQPEFLALTLTESSPDVIAYDFSCATCGQRFELECETYHGAGGHWARV
jgi:hypothetical protein